MSLSILPVTNSAPKKEFHLTNSLAAMPMIQAPNLKPRLALKDSLTLLQLVVMHTLDVLRMICLKAQEIMVTWRLRLRILSVGLGLPRVMIWRI